MVCVRVSLARAVAKYLQCFVPWLRRKRDERSTQKIGGDATRSRNVFPSERSVRSMVTTSRQATRYVSNSGALFSMLTLGLVTAVLNLVSRVDVLFLG